ncbi:MAG: RidA family protein [Deltaproteobacteria bacterium]|nr:RidA family protein [Deltaproteobacteria bacterium]MCZ6561408.1 RidA family protein [Deltaproteobacteria bacterium]MCZ6621998.1 RidA family protein [Deltaproteobacteria bacterium]MCZ6906080.1 RidA family protein [Deltaproteobacteria bacterium]
MPLEHINPKDVFLPRNDAYTMVITSTGTKQIHLSGVTGKNKDRQFAGDGGMASQVRVTIENIVKMLAAAGAKPSDVVRMTIYTTDMNLYLKEGDAERNTCFEKGKRPVGTLVEVSRLADPKCLVEISAIAVIDN